MSEDKKSGDGIVGKIVESGREVVLEVYRDGLKESVQIIGNAAAGVLRLAFGSFEAAGRAVGYLFHRASKKLPPISEARALPPGNIAAPIMLNYALLGEDEAASEELRDAYASLLASAIDPKTASLVHPSFPSMIAQMTPEEARIVKRAADSGDDEWPLMKVMEQMDKWDTRFRGWLCSLATDFDWQVQSRAVANLARLQLFETEHSTTQDTDVYDDLRDRIPEGPNLHGHMAVLALTPLGAAFIRTCVR